MKQNYSCVVCGRSGVRLYREYGSSNTDELVCCSHLDRDAAQVPFVCDADGVVYNYCSAPEYVIDYFFTLPE